MATDKRINKRLRQLRLSLELSQEAIGAQGFVSTPGWVKIENGTRQPSDVLLEKLASWLVKDGYIRPAEKKPLLEELLTLKYMEHLSPFVRRLATGYHEAIKSEEMPLAAEDPHPRARRRG